MLLAGVFAALRTTAKSMVTQSLQPCSVYLSISHRPKKNRARKAYPPSVGGRGIEHTRALSQNGTTAHKFKLKITHTHTPSAYLRSTDKSMRKCGGTTHSRKKGLAQFCLILGRTPAVSHGTHPPTYESSCSQEREPQLALQCLGHREPLSSAEVWTGLINRKKAYHAWIHHA